MKALTSILILLAAVMAAGPASATRARDYIDADHRGYISMPAARATASITLAQPLDGAPTAASAGEEDLPQQELKPDAIPTLVSTVPEPSGFAMLSCGLLLLLLVPFGRDADAITPEQPGL